MGTVNYMTSDYITMGIKPYNENEFINDTCFMDELKKQAQADGISKDDFDEYANESIKNLICSYYEDDHTNAEVILNEYSFYYFHVSLKWGYYEGVSLFIENNFKVCYDSTEDKREAQKEITQIKKMLLELSGVGFVACYPSWCTGYEDRDGTVKEIDKAIKDMRADVYTIPTWYTLKRAGEI